MGKEYYKDEHGVWRIKEEVKGDATTSDLASDDMTAQPEVEKEIAATNDLQNRVFVQEEVPTNKVGAATPVRPTPEINYHKTNNNNRLMVWVILGIIGGVFVLVMGSIILLTSLLLGERQSSFWDASYTEDCVICDDDFWNFDPLEATALPADMKIAGSNNLFIDQMNTNNGVAVALEGNILYVSGLGFPIMRYETSFENSRVYLNEWARFIYQDARALYFLNLGNLYRMDRQTETIERLLEEVHAPKFINNMIYFNYFQDGRMPVYAYNRSTGELVELIDHTSTMFVDQGSNRIIYIDFEGIHRVDLNGANRETLASDREGIWTFIYDGQKLYWINFNDQVIAYNVITTERTVIGQGYFFDLGMLGNYVLFRDLEGNLYAVAKTGGEAQLLTTRVQSFATVGDKLMISRFDGNVYVMDLNGNIALIPRESFWDWD